MKIWRYTNYKHSIETNSIELKKVAMADYDYEGQSTTDNLNAPVML